MARKHQLRKQRTGTVINTTSKRQESDIIKALSKVEDQLNKNYKIRLHHTSQWKLIEIIDRLRKEYSDVVFHCHFKTSSIKPDGGILSLVDKSNKHYPILISEVKNQGTNDLRIKEGLKKQAKGNAIERLGKNVIGLRAAFRPEGIFPFVCFGYGCDFAPDSSILDRVSTINMFGKLCETNLHDYGPHGYFDRGSFYFREKKWTVKEMTEIMYDISERSVLYYFSKHGKSNFIVAK
jgi:type II restriction enzyme